MHSVMIKKEMFVYYVTVTCVRVYAKCSKTQRRADCNWNCACYCYSYLAVQVVQFTDLASTFRVQAPVPVHVKLMCACIFMCMYTCMLMRRISQ